MKIHLNRILPWIASIVLAGSCILWLISCQNPAGDPAQKKGNSHESPLSDAKGEENLSDLTIPTCNADSALAYTAAQVAFGPRVPNSEAQRNCALYLKEKLQKTGAQVKVQEFDAFRWDNKRLKGYNIIASFRPELSSRILLCAHWDSRPYADNEEDEKLQHQAIDGANDGASGTGVLLEVARILGQQPPQVGVDIILFDLEDSGKPRWEPNAEGDEYTWCLGSQYWAENPHIPGYTALYGILLDMVGSPNPTFCMEATSMYYAPDIMQKVWNKAASMGLGHAFQQRATGAIIDDHLFINHMTGIPTIDIIHYDMQSPTGFFPQWHTADDNMQHISAQSLKMVGDVVLAILYEY